MRRCFTVDLAPFAASLAALRRLPRYRRSVLRLNPTVRDVPGGWRYERVTPVGLRWASVPTDHPRQLLVRSYRIGPGAAEPVVRELAGADDSLRAALDNAVRDLLDLDVLQVDLALPAAPETVWAALEAVTPALLEEDRRHWVAAVGHVRQVCDHLGRSFDTLDPNRIGDLHREVEARINRLCQWAGIPGRIRRPLLHLDTGVAFEVRWDRAARRRFEDAVGEVLAFHRGDGAAERYRRVSLEGVVAAMASAADHRLLALVDGTGLRRQAPSGTDMDTHEGIFTRFTGALSPEVDAHCRRWERRLEPVHAEPCVTVEVEPGGEGPGAGPEGAFVLSSLNGGAVVTEWGRPQAGMFVARLAPALSNDGLALVTELRRRSGTSRAEGIVAAEIVGSDPVSLNTAVQPWIARCRLEPHGTSLAGLRLELEPGSLRPWVIGARGERIFPAYHSAAAIGGVDPCSWLLFRLAMGHGWEFMSFGFPALAQERASWLHLPRLVLPGGTVLSAERWTIDGKTLRAIRACDEPGRYLAWRAEAERLGLPDLLRVRWDRHPGAAPVLMRTDSPLAVSSLFLRVASGEEVGSSSPSRRRGALVRQRRLYSAASTLFGSPRGRSGRPLVLLGAEDEADRRVLVGVRPVLAGVVEVEVHLPGVGVRELAELEVDDDEAAQPAVEEEQVDAIPLVADAEPPLAADEGEVAAQLEQEALELPDERLLQIALGVLVLQAEELEDEGILDLLLGRDRVPGLRLRAPRAASRPCSARARCARRTAWRSAGRAGGRSSRRAGPRSRRSCGRGSCTERRHVVGPRQRKRGVARIWRTLSAELASRDITDACCRGSDAKTRARTER